MAADPVIEGATGAGWWREYRLWIIAAAVLLALLAVIAAVLVSGGGSSTKAQRLTALATPGDFAGITRGTVRQVDGDTVTVAVGRDERKLTLSAAATVEALLPAAADSVSPGDAISVGGAPNLVNSVAIKLVVIIPAADAAESSGGMPRDTNGWTGWEAFPNAVAPKLFGRIASIDAAGIDASGPLGNFTVVLAQNAAIRTLTAGSIDSIHGGDTIAFAGNNASAPSSVLVLPR